jgi:hypothetical protein
MRVISQDAKAIFFSLLLVLSATTPAIASSGTQTAGSASTQTPLQQDSIEYRKTATTELHEATVKGKPEKKTTLLKSLNETLTRYVGQNRVNESLFTTDRQIATQTQKQAPEVAENLANADLKLARTALEDARTTHQRLSTTGTVSYDEAQVSHHIEQAQQALEHGGGKPVARIQQYRRAWLHAQKALDIMDAAVTPRVTITTRRDPEHDGTITYQLNGTVRDVRTFEIRSVTIRLSDETTTTVELKRGTTPFATGQFNTTIVLENPRNNITVTAVDTNANLGVRKTGQSSSGNGNDDRNRGNKGNGNGNSKQGFPSRSPSIGADTLLLDADTLPDTYEQTVVGTDPFDTDSDTPKTDRDESDNGVIDGAEDFDQEGVRTFDEFQARTDPHDPDTDDDNLTDYFELSYRNLNPLDDDTDGDGTLDGQDDNEPDGLSNVREQRYETNPNAIDTDADGLTDSYEVEVTLTVPTSADSDSNRTAANESRNGVLDGQEDFENDTLESALEQNISTDPFDPDTDNDTLTDAFEHRFEAIDPTTNDTDDDGTLDPVEDPDNETLVNVDEQANGTNPTDPDTDDDLLTDAYEIRTAATDPTESDSNSSATNVDESGNGINDGNEDFDGESLETHVEQNISTDPFDPDTDDDNLTDFFEYQFEMIDPLVADTDGDSVPDGQEDPDNESLVNVREQMAGTIPLDPDTDDDNLTDKYEVSNTLTNPVVPDSDSNRTSVDEANNGIIDGVEDFDSDNLTSAKEFEIGTNPFSADTDGDGLSDYFEYTYKTLDPLDNDTDGDGLSDAREDPDGEDLINVNEQLVRTDPTDTDTDDDNLTDEFEVNASYTNPTASDSDSMVTDTSEADNGVPDAEEDLDNDTLTNEREQALGTYPIRADSDRDGLNDSYELATAGTDPLNSDSDSTRTARNESDNNVTDGAEDYDDDTLPTELEREIGTDGFTNDTDGDTLTDAFEHEYDPLDPTRPDADGDGTVDSQEDSDGDGLTSIEEQSSETSPVNADTDFDQLNDSRELTATNTDPLAPDTDEDGLLDKEELDLGTDPLSADTDSDGVRDGNETFTTSKTNESVGASVSVSGSGNVSQTVRITNSSEPVVNSESVGEMSTSNAVEYESSEAVESARVTLNYSASEATEESEQAVYRYDAVEQTFEKVGGTVNESAGTVSATVSDSGTYVALSKTEFANRFAETLPKNYSTGGEFDNSSVWKCGGKSSDCEFSEGGLTVGTGDLSGSSVDSSSSDGGLSIQCAGENFKDNGECPGSGGDDPTTTTTEEGDGDNDPIGGTDPITNSTVSRTVPFPDAKEIVMDYSVSAESRESDAYAKFLIVGEEGIQRTILSVSGSGDSGSVSKTNVDFTEFAGEEVTFKLVAKEEATIQVDSLYVSYDSDGDGLWNNEEASGFQTVAFGTVYTDQHKADSDGDGIPDGKELGEPKEGAHGLYYELNSHPQSADYDGDGLNDSQEWDDHEISIVRKHGQPWRYDANNETSETLTVTSDPLHFDTDGDGASDRVELKELHTDPEKQVTYGVTERHQEKLIDDVYQEWENADELSKGRISSSLRAIGVLRGGLSAASLETLELTDVTDDSDFVAPEDATKEGINSYTFTALDGTERTDTWYPNYVELDGSTKVWNPDTDDDGLTDGQEELWITIAEKEGNEPIVYGTNTLFGNITSSTDPDSDGDGYWDGWIGVYDTESSRNVILYREHLRDDDDGDGLTVDDGDTDGGIEESEGVPAQTGTHGSSPKHSNIHLGELYWGTDPANRGETPSPSWTFEVDFYKGSTNKLYSKQNGDIRSDWARRIERNYALYGIDVRLKVDEVVADDELPEYTIGGVGYDVDAPFSLTDSVLTAQAQQNMSSAQYIFVANRSDFPKESEWPEEIGLGGQKQSGINLYGAGNWIDQLLPVGVHPQGILVFADRYQQQSKLKSRKTAVHEIAHSFQTGEADDDCSRGFLGEIYSGDDGPADLTPEEYDGDDEWSVMTSGWDSDLTKHPMDGDYFAFSIEELLSTTMNPDAPCLD